MRRKALLNPIEMSKSLVTISVLMLLLLLVPCEIFAIGKTTLVSVSSTGVQGNDDSESWGRPSISSDGRYVAFTSSADNLVEGDSNNTGDAFVHDRQIGQTTLVSVSSAGVQGNSGSGRPSISSDGRYVAFVSIADNLVDDDSNNDRGDVFVHDRQTGQTTLVSVSSAGVQGNNRSYHESISSNGRYVVFLSDADNLVDGDSNNAEDVFVHDRQIGQTTLVSVSSAGVQGAGNHDDHPSISSDGPYVAYSSNADNLVNGDNNNLLDVFVHDRQTGQTTLVSVSSKGVQGNDQSWQPSISADGRYVAFKSNADNLVDADSNNVGDVFVHDRQTGQTTLVSVSSAGVQGNGYSGHASISSDGRYVAFRSSSDNLVNGDSNNVDDVFVHDRQTGQTTRLSVSSTGVQGNGYSWILSISSDGRYVAFTSSADNLVDGDSNNNRDVFVHDRLPVPVPAGHTLPWVPLLLLGD